jgi:hypothetical protein
MSTSTYSGFAHAIAYPYPVSVSVRAEFDHRDRLTGALRPVLAIPHAILCGPVYLWSQAWSVGLIGAAAYVLAVVNWCGLLFVGAEAPGARQSILFYLRWRTRALAYMALFVDRYPPFGEGAYPASIDIAPITQPRDRLSIAVRPLLAIPHVIALAFLVIAWFVITVVAWCAIVFTGRYPQGAYPFAFGVMRWALRVEAYLLLIVDDYPPFTLEG